MCGLAGYLTPNVVNTDSGRGILGKMCDAIAHRGPDAEGFWLNPATGIGLGHRRLAILDLTAAGAQPMTSKSGRWVVAFNGEIYNHLQLRQTLDTQRRSSSWVGHSDTETLLAGFDAWGITETLQKASGMFALAVWDNQQKELTLARDRLGEKPLYYGWQGNPSNPIFLFGSDLAALRRHPAFTAEINRQALALYLRFNSIGGELSIYEGIHKLLPGHLVTVSLAKRSLNSTAYWSLVDVAQNGANKPFAGTDQEAISILEQKLLHAVGQQTISDVPLGAFLSGGIDSTTVVALMQKQSSQPVKTFTIGFQEPGYNEAEHAAAVAQHLGTDHTELYIAPEKARAVIPELPRLYAEPFADSSQIPTYLVSQLACQHVTVTLSGDGGDELFGGYNRYAVTAQLWHRLARIPVPIRRLLANGITTLSPTTWNQLAGFLPYTRIGEKLHKGASVLASNDLATLYRDICSTWLDPNVILIKGTEPKDFLARHEHNLSQIPEISRMMNLDMLTYLPDDILTKVDRAAMGVSLETRIPFLDPSVVEFAAHLPLELKIRGGVSKWILREVLYRHVPRVLMERPKMGFSIPLATWLRGPLREWAETLLCEQRLKSEGYFHHQPIRDKWLQHVNGQRDWSHQLWNILMFQSWLEHQQR